MCYSRQTPALALSAAKPTPFNPNDMLLRLLALTLPLLAIGDIQVPMAPQEPVPYVPETSILPSIADLLTIEPSASIFYSYARETELSGLFTGAARATVLVPTNKAVIALPRKP
jgi:hypothetical protein